MEHTLHTVKEFASALSRMREGISVLLYLSPHATEHGVLPYLAVWPIFVFLVCARVACIELYWSDSVLKCARFIFLYCTWAVFCRHLSAYEHGLSPLLIGVTLCFQSHAAVWQAASRCSFQIMVITLRCIVLQGWTMLVYPSSSLDPPCPSCTTVCHHCSTFTAC